MAVDRFDAASDVGVLADTAVDGPNEAGPEAGPDGGLDVAVTDAPLEAAYDAGAEAGPIVTITGGSYKIVEEDAGVCSVSGSTATSFLLTNDRDASVDLVWVNYTCGEQAYGTIAPLGTKNQGTYVTHVWRIRNDADKAFLAEFVLNAAASYSVTVH